MENRKKFEGILFKEIDEIPDGEWKQETQCTFRRVGQKLLHEGLSVEQIVTMLSDIYYAVANEFGY